MHTPCNIERWVFVYPNQMYNDVDTFYNLMTQVGGPLGVRVMEPQWAYWDDDGPSVAKYVEQLKSWLPRGPNMVSEKLSPICLSVPGQHL